MKKSIKLKWKVFAFLLGFCGLLLGILWLFQTVFLNDMYKLIRSSELKQAIAQVEREIGKSIEDSELEEVLERIEEEKDITVRLTREFMFPPFGYTMNPSDIVMQIPGYITEVREFELEDGYVISLTFHAAIVPVNATVSTLRTQLFFVTIVMIILSVALAVIIAKRVSKPIEDINRNALTLATGDYDVRFDGKGFHEITELSNTLNTAAIELGRVETLRRELLANVSHDLRTPLTLIYSYAEMMSDFPDEITENQVSVIMDETRRLTSLVNDILDLSKQEDALEELNKSSFNLTDSILRITKRIQVLLEADGYTISFNYDEDAYINADESKIGRAFYNLLINAVNYSGECKVITVTQSVYNGRVKISVSDNGEGIAGVDIPYVWDRYYKSGKAHKRAVTGTGLGLSIVRKIIELHKGNYGVESEIGKGSLFWFEVDTIDIQ
ncbi:MAG: HAMP domain-containing histidine kinase [Oscillospiraceae bacterium]|nr:HAMP domain-containing histidine kinase [Oscillospiraceae bacterium]